MTLAISDRGRAFPPSPIRKLVPRADRAKAAGKRVYHLNIGQPDIPTPAAFFQAVRRFSDAVLAYGPSGGIRDFVEALREYYGSWGYDFGPEEVIPTFGGSEAIVMAMMLCAPAGAEILIPEPFYTNYRCFALMAGLQIRPIETDPARGYALPPLEVLRELVGPDTRAIMLNSPNNPTGHVLSEGELDAVAELALAHDLFILSDEVYREFVFDGGRHRSPMDRPELRDRVVIIDSISKVFSACGARVGCIASKNPEVMRGALHLAQGRLCAATLEQIGAAAAYRARQEYLAPLVEEYRRRREAVFEGLGAIPGVRGLKPSGAFYTLVELPVDDAERFVTWMLTDFEDEGETVMLAPGEGFYATPGKGRREVRIAFVLKEGRLRRAMEILARGLAAYPAA
jgi:aspartate aminotransferase